MFVVMSLILLRVLHRLREQWQQAIFFRRLALALSPSSSRFCFAVPGNLVAHENKGSWGYVPVASESQVHRPRSFLGDMFANLGAKRRSTRGQRSSTVFRKLATSYRPYL